MDEQETLFGEIAVMPMRTLADVAVRFEAVAMELIDGNLILEEAAQRRVATLRRDLRKLASPFAENR